MSRAYLKTKSYELVTDAKIGGRLKLRRSIMGLSQTKLADLLGITFQQVQKYESGKNRVSAARLHEISKILDVPLDYFYQDCLEDSPPPSLTDEHSAEAYFDDRESLSVLKAYYAVEDTETRKAVLTLLKQLSKSE